MSFSKIEVFKYAIIVTNSKILYFSTTKDKYIETMHHLNNKKQDVPNFCQQCANFLLFACVSIIITLLLRDCLSLTIHTLILGRLK